MMMVVVVDWMFLNFDFLIPYLLETLYWAVVSFPVMGSCTVARFSYSALHTAKIKTAEDGRRTRTHTHNTNKDMDRGSANREKKRKEKEKGHFTVIF